jgi:hypothetical protein
LRQPRALAVVRYLVPLSFVLVGLASPAWERVARGESTSDAFRYDPPSIEAPRLRNAEPRTTVYIDGTYGVSNDLSALPDIAGKAQGFRVAAGGTLKLGRFQLDAELPAGQVTTLSLVNPNPLFDIDPNDKHQTAASLGDSRLGAQWTGVVPTDAMAVVAGFGISVRIPTHTTEYTFHLTDGSPGFYALPYYFHIQPTFIMGEALGPVSFVMNQSALILIGPNATVADIPIVIPTIYFWDAHYGVSVRVVDGFAVTCALNTTYQLNSLDKVMFPHLNKLRSAYVVPGVQVHLGAYRIDLVGRFGIKAGAEPLGVLTFQGTDSLTVRVSRLFD